MPLTRARLIPLAVLLLFATGATSFAATKANVSAALNYQALPPNQQAVIAVVFDIPPGYHIQSNKPTNPAYIPTEVTLSPNPAIEAYAPIFPPDEIRNYPALGRLNVYEGKAIVYIPIRTKPNAPQGPLHLEGTAQYQMCNDQTCFPPDNPTFAIDTTIVAPGTPLLPNQPELFSNFDPSEFAKLMPAPVVKPSGPKVFGRELGTGLDPFAFLAAFLVGIIFNIMPCVLPVVPLKIMGFYEVSQHNRLKSLLLSLVFGAGIVLVFAVLGFFVVVLRKFDWGELYKYWQFRAAIVVLMLVLAGSMFNVFTVLLPTSIYNFTPRHDTYLGNFLFGILTAILSTPCTFGLFFALLVWAVAQPAAVGLSLLITVGIGMAFPYIVLSAFPEVARNFPRTGPWAELVKQLMGFLLIASAVFFARGFIEGPLGEKAFWWMLFAVVAAAGIYLIVRSIQYSRTMVGRLVATAVALLLVLPSLAFTLRQTNPPIDWKRYDPAAVAAARESGRIVMVEFTAAWCGNCIALETSTFHDPRTVEAIKRHRAVAFRADLTDKTAPGWPELRKITPVGAIPLTAIFSAKLTEPIQLTGIYSASDLAAALETASRGEKSAVADSASQTPAQPSP
jgi:thiol:disulfide interchange protein